MTKDLTPYLYGLAPDPEGVSSARTYAPFHRAAPMQRLEEFSMCLALFYKDRAGPGLPEGVSEAVRVFLFAASGFLAILEDVGEAPGADWKALSFASMWARSERNREGAALTAEEKEDLDRALTNPYALPLLPVWAGQLRAAGKAREAARFATWATLARLLEDAPLLEDGEAEGALVQLLEGLAHPVPAPEATEDPPRYEKPDARPGFLPSPEDFAGPLPEERKKTMPDPRTEAAHLEAARLNVRAFLEVQPAPDLIRARLEDLPGVFRFMASEHVDTPMPAQREACRVLEDSAAHLLAFLSSPVPDPFALRALAHSFEAHEVGEASGALLPEVGDATPEDVTGPEAWAAWYSRAVRYGQHMEAARYAATWQAAALISAAGLLEDGEAEDALARLLEVLAYPVPTSPEDPAPTPLDPSLN